MYITCSVDMESIIFSWSFLMVDKDYNCKHLNIDVICLKSEMRLKRDRGNVLTTLKHKPQTIPKINTKDKFSWSLNSSVWINVRQGVNKVISTLCHFSHKLNCLNCTLFIRMDKWLFKWTNQFGLCFYFLNSILIVCRDYI